jgi:hypothetical protein
MSEFVKDDKGKPQFSLMPPVAWKAIAKVLTFGAKKYSRNNWEKCEDLNQYVDATLRHINAYMSGERIDADSGEHNLACACCSLMFIIDIEEAENRKEKNSFL